MKKLIAAMLLGTVLVVGGCNSEKIYSNPETEATAAEEVTYEDLNTDISEFSTVFNAYLNEHMDDVSVARGDGTTPAGQACTYEYLTCDTYRKLTLTEESDDAVTVEEYFDMTDGRLFLARTTAYNDGTYGDVEKYIISGDTIYILNGSDKTVETRTVADSGMQIYYSFDEIAYVYETGEE